MNIRSAFIAVSTTLLVVGPVLDEAKFSTGALAR
jgi:hypothetical protein